jgi:hypothetical protein
LPGVSQKVCEAGQVNTTGGATGTVNVAVAVAFGAHELVAVQVTVTAPPHIGGAAAGALLVTVSAHPPLLVTPASHVAYAASI